MTLSRPRVRGLLDGFGLTPSRALGQNFVTDPNTVRRIVAESGVNAGERVLEVGPGLGSLTLALVERGCSVVAVEMDRHLVPALREVLAEAGAQVELINADAMQVDLASLGLPVAMVANLPYNVAVPIVLRLAEGMPSLRSMTALVQREVADRLAAAPGSKTYGAPSLAVAWWGRAKVTSKVPASVFMPKPRVDSAVVRIDRHDPAPLWHASCSRERYEQVVRAAFAQRRKMLRSSLRGVVPPEAFAAAGLTGDERAEQLDAATFAGLAGYPSPS